MSTLTRSSRTLSISARHVSLNTPAPTSIVLNDAEDAEAVLFCVIVWYQT
jgi:hypothetical protein